MKKSEIVMLVSFGLFVVSIGAAFVFGAARFKQRDRVYTYVDYDLNEETGLVSVKVEGQKLTIDADKIVSLPTDYESGNALYVTECKTFFFTKTVYEVKRFVILVPTDGKGDDWKLGV